MSNYEILEKKPLANIEVKKFIDDKVQERELTYREERIKDFLKEKTKLSYENYLKAKEELIKLNIARLEEKHIIKILEIMPLNGTELRSIVSHTGTVLVDESVQKILNVLNSYRV